jgi:hypothetical protein
MEKCFLLLLFGIILYCCLAATEFFLTDFAGSGVTGYLGENLPATSAEISPYALW